MLGLAYNLSQEKSNRISHRIGSTRDEHGFKIQWGGGVHQVLENFSELRSVWAFEEWDSLISFLLSSFLLLFLAPTSVHLSVQVTRVN